MRIVALIIALMTLPASAQDVLDDSKPSPEVVCEGEMCTVARSSNSSFWYSHFLYLRIEPRVFELGFKGPFTLTAGVVDSTITSARIHFTTFNDDDTVFSRDGSSQMILSDDGTNGDEVAGDYVFTVDDVYLSYDENAFDEAVVIMGHSRFGMTAVFPDGSGRTFELMAAGASPLDMFAYDPSRMPDVRLKQLSENAVASDHILNIAYDKVTPIYFYAHLDDRNSTYHNCEGEFNQECATDQHVVDVYQYVQNDYDQLISIHAGKPTFSNQFAQFANPITGIGAQKTENTLFPFASALKGRTDYKQKWDPRTFSRTLTRSLLRQYRFNFTPWDEVSDRPDLGIQWGYGAAWGDSQYGQNAYVVGKSGFGSSVYYRATSVEQLTDSKWRIHYNWNDYLPHWEYNDVELYLMGLMSPDEDPDPLYLFWGWQSVEHEPDYPSYLGRATAIAFEVDSVDVVSVEEMISWGGPRIPAASEQDNTWNVLYFIPFYRTMTAEELAVYEYFIREYEKEQSDVLETTFFQATRGRGRLSSLISFREGVGVENNELPNRLSISSVYPNPARTSVSLRFEIDKSSPVILEVFDLLGRSVEPSTEAFFNTGVHEFQLDVSQWSSGFYYARIKAQGNSDTYPLLVTK